eukprot:1148392-Pelagomonas_calceolata.AAC.12
MYSRMVNRATGVTFSAKNKVTTSLAANMDEVGLYGKANGIIGGRALGWIHRKVDLTIGRVVSP